MVEFLVAMAINAMFAFWGLSALAAGFIAISIPTIRRYEWDELSVVKKVALPLILILSIAHTLAFVTYLTESFKAAGC